MGQLGLRQVTNLNIWEFIASGPIPDTESCLDLYRRGDEFEIRIDTRQLMNTRLHGSEDALSDLAFDRMSDQDDSRVLVGGLGVGFTLAAALRRSGSKGRVVVAELVPSVIEWNRGPLGNAAGRPLDDPRASVHCGDVSDLIRTPPDPWHAILLDVDNGPSSLTRESNHWLYSHHGLDTISNALVPGGILGVWSANPDRGFTRRFERAGYRVEPIEVRARGKKGGRRHLVWIGRKEQNRRQTLGY
jgi:spermidine synthase